MRQQVLGCETGVPVEPAVESSGFVVVVDSAPLGVVNPEVVVVIGPRRPAGDRYRRAEELPG